MVFEGIRFRLGSLRRLGNRMLCSVPTDAAARWSIIGTIEDEPLTGNLPENLEFGFINVSPASHVGILRSARSREAKDRAQFWGYLHAEN